MSGRSRSPLQRSVHSPDGAFEHGRHCYVILGVAIGVAIAVMDVVVVMVCHYNLLVLILLIYPDQLFLNCCFYMAQREYLEWTCLYSSA